MGSVLTEPFLIISEYMSGGTVQDRCLGKPASWTQFAHWSVDLARAITFLHNCHPPIVHGNLNPSTLLLNADDHLCVSNFGNSQVIIKHKKRKQKSSRSGPIDTTEEKYSEGARYASPEALALRHASQEALAVWHVDDRTDIWSLGMVLFFMASGMHPHQHLSVDKAVELLLSCQSPDLTLMNFNIKEVSQLISDATNPVSSARPAIGQVFEKVKEWPNIKASVVGETHGKCMCAVS
mmetsp:Transcript_12050/g.28136  ORF Transcript_12050/g.28136 Transcript_12050/m.28136 type:complete len:237 (+) Transcript_12050:1-711(+)